MTLTTWIHPRFLVPMVAFELLTMTMLGLGYYLEGHIYLTSQFWTSMTISCLAVQIVTQVGLIIFCALGLTNPHIFFAYGPFSVARASLMTALTITWFKSVLPDFLFYKPAILVVGGVYWLICVWLTIIWFMEFWQRKKKAKHQRERKRRRDLGGGKTVPRSHHGSKVSVTEGERGRGRQHNPNPTQPPTGPHRERVTRPIKVVSDGPERDIPLTHHHYASPTGRHQRYGALNRIKAQSKLLLYNVAKVINSATYGNSHHTATVAMRDGGEEGRKEHRQSFVDPETGERMVLTKVIIPSKKTQSSSHSCTQSCCIGESSDRIHAPTRHSRNQYVSYENTRY